MRLGDAAGGASDLVARANVSGQTSVILIDPATGETLDQFSPMTALPPASVAKTATALYALETLGRDFVFDTTLIATGPVSEGTLSGDLILAGSGDPTMDTDDLLDLSRQLAATGIRRITGRFLIWDGALPYAAEIEPGQMDHLGYNPSVSGLNLNYNRVFFEWAKQGSGFTVRMDARSEKVSPAVSVARMQVVDRDAPVYTYAENGDFDDWTVSKAALNDNGGYWLPVRHPGLYCGDVLRTLAAADGVTLPVAERMSAPASGQVIATVRSAPLIDIAKDCLKYSTNLVAESIGLKATAVRSSTPRSIAESAGDLNDWVLARTGSAITLHDHCGLSGASRCSSASLAQMLAAPNVSDLLEPILKTIPLTDDKGNRITGPTEVKAKTGTLNFASTLAGYIHCQSGRTLAFAIMSADLDKRQSAIDSNAEIPAGARSWAGRARRLQQGLLQHWGAVY